MRNGHRHYSRTKRQSTCGDIIVRGDALEIASKYEMLAKEAWIAGDAGAYHRFLNHCEHWRKNDCVEN